MQTIKSFKCLYCDFTFGTAKLMEDHWLHEHSTAKMRAANTKLKREIKEQRLSTRRYS